LFLKVIETAALPETASDADTWMQLLEVYPFVFVGVDFLAE
jgi:hypothetical protein